MRSTTDTASPVTTPTAAPTPAVTTSIEPEEVRTTTAVVGSIDDLAESTMKMAKVGERRVAVIRTASGVHALDNACPHQGYGLVTGSLDGELLTCQWHNWKFRASDGTCVMGEEDVACHRVDIADNGDISVTVTEPSPAAERARLWPSLARGFERNYVGQMARDTARLLRAGADPVDIVWEGMAIAAPRAEYGIGHGMAMATDCLHLLPLWTGIDRTLPVVQALSGLAEPTRDRRPHRLPEPDVSISLRDAIENEDVTGAMASVLGQLGSGATADDMRPQFIDATTRHHLSYGHGAIYTQKSFELLELAGWHRASELLPWLAMAITYGTREDTLPYMRPAMRDIEAVELAALADAPDRAATGWVDADNRLRTAILDSPRAAIAEAATAVRDGAGIEGLLDTVTLAVSERLLRYDPATDFDHTTDFGWLDITHGLTYANAARWAWRHHPSPATARLALFTVFLAHDTGRAERWAGGARPTTLPEPMSGDLEAAIADGDADRAVAIALGDGPDVADALARAAMSDRATAAIVVAHVIKLTHAANQEAEVIGSPLPRAADARFAASPRLERFVARNVAEAIDFIETGTPPKR